MMTESQTGNALAMTRQQTMESSTQADVSTERMLNDIADHLEGLLGDVPLIRMCTLWVAAAHLGHVWSHCPWLYVGLPEHDQGGRLLLDVLQPLMPASWDAGKDLELPKQAMLRQRQAEFDCSSKAVSDFLCRLGHGSTISALIGHVLDPSVGRYEDSARRSVIITGPPSWRSSAEVAKKAVTYTTTGLGSARVLSKSDVMEAGSLRLELDAWVYAVEDSARQARIRVPGGLSGTTSDLWRPMLTIAELAGEEWSAWAAQLAVQDALVQTYGALARLSELIVSDECGRSISSWNKGEESELLWQVRSLMTAREDTLDCIIPD